MGERALAPVFSERRGEQRCQTGVPAKLVDMLGHSHDCTIVDISGSGCRIRLPEAAVLKGSVELTAADGSKTAARVVWSAGDVVGLWFACEREGEPRPAFLMGLWERLLGG